MMKLPIINLPNTQEQVLTQISKIEEEAKEVYNAVIDGESVERILEECWDTIEATMNMMHLVASKSQIEQSNGLHFMKLKSRGHEFTHFIDMNF